MDIICIISRFALLDRYLAIIITFQKDIKENFVYILFIDLYYLN